MINTEISQVKIELGQYEEAIEILKETSKYELNTKRIYDYCFSLILLADALILQNKYDEALTTSQKGFATALKYNDVPYQHTFKLLISICEFYKKNIMNLLVVFKKYCRSSLNQNLRLKFLSHINFLEEVSLQLEKKKRLFYI
ncbi:MAG: hypothetical protein HC854_07630 [Flavobacterium sp.]|nr:hypothetical protein [Flavobacterium sp.]